MMWMNQSFVYTYILETWICNTSREIGESSVNHTTESQPSNVILVFCSKTMLPLKALVILFTLKRMICWSSGGSRISHTKGCHPNWWAHQHLFLPFFRKNCIKWKKNGPRGARVSGAPIGFANVKFGWKSWSENIVCLRNLTGFM